MDKIIKLFRSILFCLRYLPISQAIKLPIILDSPIKVILCKRGQIVLKNISFGIVRLSMERSKYITNPTSVLYLEANSKLIFEGSSFIGSGFSIAALKNSYIKVGNNTFINKNFFIKSSPRCSVVIGSDCKIGWSVEINTSDGHAVIRNGRISNYDASICINNHVWLGAHCSIGKGVEIASNNIVAKGSIVTKSVLDQNVVVGGIPGKVIGQGLNWSNDKNGIRS